jgi:hypothetical protein
MIQKKIKNGKWNKDYPMKIAQRLQKDAWQDDECFQDVYDFLHKYRDTVDEITLMSGSPDYRIHESIETIREESLLLKARMDRLREAGFTSVGINVLITLGHIDETTAPNVGPFHKIVGYRGDTSATCCCPTYEDFLEFTEEKYRCYARATPDFLWVDDDIKLFWNGVPFGCFCPNCMDRFNRKYGTAYTRETLVAAMEIPDNTLLRSRWVQDISDRITELLGRIGRAVRQVNPALRLGFMTQHQGWSTYNGMDFDAWFRALGAAKGRPGEGYYFDTVPDDVLTKALSTSRQACEYPDMVDDVQYELENFPGYTWQKSNRIFLAELGMVFAQGMNGVLLNNCHTRLGFEGQGPLYDAMRAVKPNWQMLMEYTEGFGTAGFYPALSKEYDKRRTLHGGESFFQHHNCAAEHNITRSYALAKMGIPLTMDRASRTGVILSGNLSEGFTDAELLEFLKGPVIVDGEGVAALERRGFEKYLGVRCLGTGGLGLMERHNMADPVNRFVRRVEYRDVKPAFFGGSACLLKAISEDTRTVSVIEDCEGHLRGIGTSLFENELGGRVCVLGYCAYLMPNDVNRFHQLSAICDYLTQGRQPAKLLTPAKAAQFVRVSPDGKKAAVSILNMTLDDMHDIRVAVRNASKGRLLDGRGGNLTLTAEKDGDYGAFTLEKAEPYTLLYLLTE